MPAAQPRPRASYLWAIERGTSLHAKAKRSLLLRTVLPIQATGPVPVDSRLGYGLNVLFSLLGATANPERMRLALLVCPIACACGALILWLGSVTLARRWD